MTTKLLHPKTPPMPDIGGELYESLRRLRTDYVDLLLIHWPNPNVSLEWALGEFAATVFSINGILYYPLEYYPRKNG